MQSRLLQRRIFELEKKREPAPFDIYARGAAENGSSLNFPTQKLIGIKSGLGQSRLFLKGIRLGGLSPKVSELFFGPVVAHPMWSTGEKKPPAAQIKNGSAIDIVNQSHLPQRRHRILK
jgi:hypothetical protein